MLSDFLAFSRLHCASRDVDPMYDVLRAMLSGQPQRQQVAFVLYYVAWYNACSALQAWRENGGMAAPPSYVQAKRPTGIERRGFRDGYSLMRHWDSVTQIAASHGGLLEWLRPDATWVENYAQLQLPYGNGRWAAYKTCELLQKVCGYSMVPADLGNAGSSGPLAGLKLLYPNAVDYDKAGLELFELMKDFAADLGEVETCLCDFHSMVQGHYYVGHDIDHMQTDIMKMPADIQQPFWWARKSALPNQYLGELNGWVGVDKLRNTEYARTRRILHR